MSPAARERRFRRIREVGCNACRKLGVYTVPEVHHQNLGGHAGHKRLGDEFTEGLCCYHHRGVPHPSISLENQRFILGPSLAKLPNKFREVFGTDAMRLKWTNEKIEEREKFRVGA